MLRASALVWALGQDVQRLAPEGNGGLGGLPN